MATQIQKTGAFPSVSITYQNNYMLSDTTVGKYLSLSGPKQFYNPGIGLLLQSPNSGTTTSTNTQSFTVTTYGLSSSGNISLNVSISQQLNFNLTITAYLNYTIGGANGGSGIQTINIPSGQTVGTAVINNGSNSVVTNITPIITNITNGSTTLDWTYGNTNSIATVSTTITQTTSATGTFTNTLNIPDFNVSSINFYGASRDTLILKGNILTI